MTENVARQIADWVAAGRAVTTGRIIGISGFSTWPGGQLVAFDGAGGHAGEVLGPIGTAKLEVAASPGRQTTRVVTVGIHGAEVAEAGLSCGGEAEVLLQPAAALPARLWTVLAGRAPAALVTPLDDGGGSTLVEPDGTVTGPALASADLADQAVRLLASGRSSVERSETHVVEAWVPPPRLVVVGAGDVVGALEAQAGLLGWETGPVDSGDLAESLAWAGGSAAVVVLSHDPHVDVPALQAALEAGAAYVGAMGSRRTQSRRLERLRAAGVADEVLDRIHRPVGLDLGGRSAPEVALSICAEILAVRHGRDGRSLRDRGGPIHDPAARAGGPAAERP